MIKAKIKRMDLKLRLGTEYEIVDVTKTKRNGTLKFKGILIQKTDNFYVFKCRSGYCECFLKVDFAINIYSIKKKGESIGKTS